MILFAVHRTTYRYPRPSRDSHNEVRLMPIDGREQLCFRFDLEVSPRVPVDSYEEPGGAVHHFHVPGEHCTLEIEARSVVRTYGDNPFQGLNLLQPDWSGLAALASQAAEFLQPTRSTPHCELVRELAESVPAGGSVARYAIDLGEALHDLLAYDPDATHVHTTLMEVLEGRAGVCQDFAHVMLAALRCKGIPARYVSGYLYVGEPGSLRGEQAMHAWVDALMPDGRWLSLDPTNRQLANNQYIRVHTGVDYHEVAPTRGVYFGPPAEALEVGVQVWRDQGVEVVEPLGHA